jgi:hypothetical protein
MIDNGTRRVFVGGGGFKQFRQSASAKVGHTAVETVNIVPIFSGTTREGTAHSNVLSRKEAQMYLLLHFDFDCFR